MSARLEKVIWVVVMAAVAVVVGWAGCGWYNQRELDRRLTEYRDATWVFESAVDFALGFDADMKDSATLHASWEYTAQNIQKEVPEMGPWDAAWPLNPYTREPIREVGYHDTEYYGDVMYLREVIEYSGEYAYVKDYHLVQFRRLEQGMEPGIYWRFGPICCDVDTIAFGLSPAEVLDGFCDPALHHLLPVRLCAEFEEQSQSAPTNHFLILTDKLAACELDRERIAFVDHREWDDAPAVK